MGQLLIPEPMTDELDFGHAGRTIFINGLKSVRDLVSCTLAAQHMPRQFPYRELVLALANSGVEGYLSQHSLIPYYCVALPMRQGHKSWHAVLTSFKRFQGAALPNWRLCNSCAQEDANDFGFSWWRREHQLPGIEICMRHQTGLIACIRSDAYLGQPHRLLDPNNSACVQTAPASSHPMVRRYRTLLRCILSSPPMDDFDGFRFWVRSRCKSLGISFSSRDRSHAYFLSKHIKHSFPDEWLAAHYRRLTCENYGGFDCAIDHVGFDQNTTPVAFALVLTALLEASPEELHGTTPPCVHNLMLGSRTQLATKTEERAAEQQAFLDAYVQGEGSRVAIARSLGIDEGFASLRSKHAGLPALWHAPRDAKRIIVERIRSAPPDLLNSWTARMHAHWESQSGVRNRFHDWTAFLAIQEELPIPVISQ